MYKKTTDTTWLYKNITTCTAPEVFIVNSLDPVSTYHFASFAVNEIGTGPTTDAASYQIQTTYGKPSTPARPTLAQNNDKTVTLTFMPPSPLNAVSGSSVTYKFEVRNADGTDTWTDLVQNMSSSLTTTLTKTFNMQDLKTKAGYVNANKGNAIKIRFTATNNNTVESDPSEANSDSAIYKDVPDVYAGTITPSSITVNSAVLSWTDVTNPALYGYSVITGWKYWYNSTSGVYVSGTTLPSV